MSIFYSTTFFQKHSCENSGNTKTVRASERGKWGFFEKASGKQEKAGSLKSS